MSGGKRVVIVGGHGNVALRLARLIGPSNDVTSIIRTPEHEPDIITTSAKSLLLSLEDASVSEFTSVFQGKDVVYFSAGAGGRGGPERTKKVDYEGALKVFDAIEGVRGQKPRLILVSAIDVRDPEKVPEWYDEADLDVSKRYRDTLATYVHWKYEADKNLVQRTAFPWTILRPSGLSNEPGTGKADIGRTHITRNISRDDVARTLALLLDRPDAAGLALDLVGGQTPLEDGLDTAIKNKVTAWIG
ncbi:NAD(P)-binding protein [Neolentinus lepideus HHB14362 ss-1]|uniref:NAD(P)-binding protein n=1 Tax=Neolentinus lepideus HHB14362 ss-1 TaxID=1314782 RepID=A0A165PPR8_9AGAM|nr:NAD(P)-binding protein [Neolentinus lepideus HHB14362 ss-1]